MTLEDPHSQTAVIAIAAAAAVTTGWLHRRKLVSVSPSVLGVASQFLATATVITIYYSDGSQIQGHNSFSIGLNRRQTGTYVPVLYRFLDVYTGEEIQQAHADHQKASLCALHNAVIV
ncbi:MAG TPA: hypothetical protein PLQ56_27470 [Aggregatilineales bacterium]|nr:hypothetical protein [Aggregatilineales bacterium]